MRKSDRGFTLIELLLVISIILLILMLTVPAMMTVRREALIACCKSNILQITKLLMMYTDENEGLVPYLFYAEQGMLDPEHMEDPETRVSGLARILESMHSDPGILKCPADNGYNGADYVITVEVVTCYSCFGQSYTYNNTFYTDTTSPYDGEQPLLWEQIPNPERVVALTDFSSVWHSKTASSDKSTKYFLNISYFDGHVEGKEFDSDRDAKTFRMANSRWWTE